jgi:dienelactone hydrolase
MPDWIPGGGVPLTSLSLMETMLTPSPWYAILSHLKRLFTFLRVMTIVIPFAIRSKPAPAAILKYARSVKAELPEGGKLGVVGICVGGMHSTRLCQETAIEGGEGRLVDAQFYAHPAGLKLPGDVIEAVTKFKVPYSFAIGDQDFLKVEKVREFEAALRENVGDEVGEGGEGGYEVRIYRGCGHGFAVRASKEKKVEDEAAGEAAKQAVDWFRKYLA